MEESKHTRWKDKIEMDRREEIEGRRWKGYERKGESTKLVMEAKG